MTPRTVITGASSGIGAATAVRCLEEGRFVIGIARTIEDAGAWTRHPSFEARPADLTDQAACRTAFAALGPIDALILSAGDQRPTPLAAPDAMRSFSEALGLNLHGSYAALTLALPWLTPSASVVLVASGLGKQGRANQSGYVASKHALLGVMRSAALELAPRGIRVNAICPGWVDTPMATRDIEKDALTTGRTAGEQRRHTEAQIPLGRFVQPGEVAELAAFLISDRARAITGQAINICCGELAA